MTTASCGAPAWSRRPCNMQPARSRIRRSPRPRRSTASPTKASHSSTATTAPVCRPTLDVDHHRNLPPPALDRWQRSGQLQGSWQHPDRRQQRSRPACSRSTRSPARSPTNSATPASRPESGGKATSRERRLHPRRHRDSTAAGNRAAPMERQRTQLRPRPPRRLGTDDRPGRLCERHRGPGPSDSLRQHRQDGDRLHQHPGRRRSAVLPLVCSRTSRTIPSIRRPDSVAEYTALGLNNTDAKYYANIERLDGGIDAILDHLDTKGIADNTIIIFICDNGRQLDTPPEGKLTPYDSGARTPIIVRWPDRIKPGGPIEPQIIRTPVSMVDMVPTVHHALGLPTRLRKCRASTCWIPPPSPRAGRSAVRIMMWKSSRSPIRRNRSKTAAPCATAGSSSSTPPAPRNSIISTTAPTPVDPHETNNLAASNPQLVNELIMEIVNWYSPSPTTTTHGSAIPRWASHPPTVTSISIPTATA